MPKGLEHLLEHLVFLPTEKYAEPNSLADFLKKTNGVFNGSTRMFLTDFIFQFDKKEFKQFAPILADSIKNPKFDLENIRKEINNVNSEIAMRIIHNKQEMEFQFLHEVGNCKSSLLSDSAFQIKVEEENMPQLQKDLVEFHKKYFSANLMKIGIVSDLDHTAIQKVLEATFGDLPNTQTPRPFYNDLGKYIQPFSAEVLNSVYFVHSEFQQNKLSLLFIVPSTINYLYFCPTEFLKFLTHFKAEKSFDETLKAEDLVTSFSISDEMSDYVHSLIGLEFKIKNKLDDKVDAILAHFYDFVEQVINSPNLEKYFEIFAKISQKNFFFSAENEFVKINSNTENDLTLAEEISHKMFNFTSKETLIGDNIFHKFEKKIFLDYLNALKESNPIIIIKSDVFPKKEQSNDGVEAGQTQDLESLDQISEILLDNSFKFDSSLFYTVRQKSPNFKTSILAKRKNTQYNFVPLINTSPFDKYELKTTCEIPSVFSKFSKVQVIFDEGQIDKQIGLLTLNTAKMREFLIHPNIDPAFPETHLNDLRAIQSMKDCLTNEFSKDKTNFSSFKLIFTDNGKEVYNLVHRQTLQEQISVIVEVQSEFLKKLLLKNDSSERIDVEITSKIFCKYLLSTHKLQSAEAYLYGNIASCECNGSNILFKFFGQPNLMSKFIADFFSFLKNVAFNTDLKNFILENERINLLEPFLQVKLYSIRDFIDHYFNLVFDLHFQNILDPTILQGIKEKIETVDFSKLLNLRSSLLDNSKTNIFVAGNIGADQTLSVYSHFKESLLGTAHLDAEYLKNFDYLKSDQEHSFLKVPLMTHYVFDVENPNTQDTNSAYSCSFYFAKVDYKTKFQANLIQYYFSNFIFDELREKRNFGYVASGRFKKMYEVNSKELFPGNTRDWAAI